MTTRLISNNPLLPLSVGRIGSTAKAARPLALAAEFSTRRVQADARVARLVTAAEAAHHTELSCQVRGKVCLVARCKIFEKTSVYI